MSDGSASTAGSSGGRSRLVLLTLLFASSLTVMSGATISPSLPGIQEQFSGNASVELLTRLVLTVPALFIAVFAPFAGTVVDRLGRKPVLLASVVLYGIAGGSGLFLSNLYAILAGRALLGVAVAGVMTSATALIADYYSGGERSRILGIQAAFMGLGGVVFLSLGGFLAGIDWRGPFVIYLSALLLAPLVALRLHEPSRDPVGPEEAGSGEREAGSPVRFLGAIFALALVGMVIFYVVPTQLPFYFESLLGIGATVSGLSIALMTLVSAAVSLSYGRIRQRLGYRSVAVATFAFLGLGYLIVGLAGSLWPMLVGLSVGGIGIGSALAEPEQLGLLRRAGPDKGPGPRRADSRDLLRAVYFADPEPAGRRSLSASAPRFW